jgi:hypothetical protein
MELVVQLCDYLMIGGEFHVGRYDLKEMTMTPCRQGVAARDHRRADTEKGASEG